MEGDICQFEKCHNEPEYECKCLNQIGYFCKSHLREHSKINTNHSISDNFKEIPEGLKEIMITQCEISLRSLKEMRNKINKKTNDIIKAIIRQTISDLDFVRKNELSIMKAIDFLNSSNKIVNKKHQTAEELFVIKHFQNTDKLKEEIETQEAQILGELDVKKNERNLKAQVEKIKEGFQEKLNILDEKQKECIANETNQLKQSIEEIKNTCKMQ